MPAADGVAQHYARGGLADAILAALAAAGTEHGDPRPEDLAPLDEFHLRGREATAELGAAMGLGAAMRVLDVGSGLGGPSRHLAAAYGCRVTGIDLSAAYCEVAALLAGRTGLADRVAYRQGDALALPFADAAFDAAITQHAAMNIEDKAALYAEVARVLGPGGVFGIYDLLRGDGGEVLYPAPWARGPAASFLVTPDGLRGLLERAGFEVVRWRDTSAEARAWYDGLRRRPADAGERRRRPALGLHLLFGADAAAAMGRNMARNVAEGRVIPTEVVCRLRAAPPPSGRGGNRRAR